MIDERDLAWDWEIVTSRGRVAVTASPGRRYALLSVEEAGRPPWHALALPASPDYRAFIQAMAA